MNSVGEQGARQCDVVVVGAGVSGLCAARRLVERGVSCVVVEARDRVGGRTLSHTLGGDVIDLGGQWIGPQQTRLAALARELGAETFPQYCDGKKILQLRGRQRVYSGSIPNLPLFSALELAWAMRRLDTMRKQTPADAPWTAAKAAEWDAVTFESWKLRCVRTQAARDVLDIATRAVFCGEPGEISLLFFLAYLSSGQGLDCLTTVTNGAQQDRMQGGMQQISLRMAEALGDRVVLEAPVRSVEQSSDRVLVRTDQGAFAAQYAIVAIPPALAGRIHYESPLPARRDHLTQRMPMGSVIKYVIGYDEPFWRKAGLSGEAVSDSGPVGLAFDDTSHDGRQPALVAFSDGAPALEWSGRPADERRQAVLEALAGWFGPRALEPTEFLEKSWIDEPWSRGCYVGLMGPGTLTALGKSLRAPCGRLHWAGTETAREWLGYIEGAIEAGERAADEVLARRTDSAG